MAKTGPTPEDKQQRLKQIEDCLNKPEKLCLHWQEIRSQLSFEELVYKVEEGPNKGMSLLWALACPEEFRETRTYPGINSFSEIYEEFYSQLTLDHLLNAPESGMYQNISILWLLAGETFYSPYVFLQVFNRFQNEMRLEHFLIEGVIYLKGISILWQLAFAAERYPERFLQVFQKFQSQITLQHLLIASENEPAVKGRSVLWNLAYAVKAKKPEPFLKVFEQFQDIILLEHFLVEATPEENLTDKGRSALFHLVHATFFDERQAFSLFFEKFKHQLTIQHLTVPVSQWGYPDWTALHFIVMKNQCPRILKEILQQVPGLIPNTPYLSSSLTQHSATMLFAVEARNKFFSLLEEANAFYMQNKVPYLFSLFEEAERTQTAGYVNAFFDLGQLFLRHRMPEQALKAYKQVTPCSWHYAKVTTWLIESTKDDSLNDFEIQPSLRFSALSIQPSIQKEEAKTSANKKDEARAKPR